MLVAATLAAAERSSGDNQTSIYAAAQSWDGQCKAGLKQSPIDIQTEYTVIGGPQQAFTPLRFHFGRLHDRMLTNDGNKLSIAGEFGVLAFPSREKGTEWYTMKSVDFHQPSEHTINGRHFPAEMQLHLEIPGNPTKKVSVAILFTFSQHPHELNEFLESIQWRRQPQAGGSTPIPCDVDLGRSLAEVITGPYFHYVGSDAAPPCEEGHKWFVMEKALKMSMLQHQRIRDTYPAANGNARPIQPLNGRAIVRNMMFLPGDDLLKPRMPCVRSPTGEGYFPAEVPGGMGPAVFGPEIMNSGVPIPGATFGPSSFQIDYARYSANSGMNGRHQLAPLPSYPTSIDSALGFPAHHRKKEGSTAEVGQDQSAEKDVIAASLTDTFDAPEMVSTPPKNRSSRASPQQQESEIVKPQIVKNIQVNQNQKD